MSVKDRELINVLNYNENIVVISTRDNQYSFNPSENDVPTLIPLTFSEIEYVNSNTEAFKSGLLRFPEDIENEMYNELRVLNWEDILKNSDIRDIILHPTLEGLKKIIDIKSSSAFERVRGIFTRLKNSENENISIRVERIISARYKELINRQTKTSIILSPKDSTVSTITSEEVDSLKQQLAQMQELMLKMMGEKTEPAKVEEIPTEEEIKKSAGRPPKTK